MKKEFKYKVPVSAATADEISEAVSQFASKGAKGKITVVSNGESVIVIIADE